MAKRCKKWLAVVLTLSLLGGLGNYYAHPIKQSVAVGQEFVVRDSFPQSLWEYVTVESSGLRKQITENVAAQNYPGEMNLSLKLFGLIPLKQVSVAVMPEKYLYPGGQSIGILLRTEGVLVVGLSPIINEHSRKLNPAEDAGIEPGDVIVKLNNQEIVGDDQLAEMVDEIGKKGEEIVLEVDHGGKIRNVPLKAVFCTQSGKWRIGLLVRDNAGGIGTLTFVDADGNYGALGHMVAESNTGEILNISLGKLVRSSINGINKGERGKPGEKIGSFTSDYAVGDIKANTNCGIFGKINDLSILKDNIITEPLPVGFCSEVEYGKAQILTVIEDDQVEAFDVEIMKIMPNGKIGKELVIKITDERLLEKTGGIVQGMSGSPIIQNNKIIGAITYVMVNDPSRGYGILIENMLEKVG